MQGKITLITPPDIYENGNKSILFAHLTDAEQEQVSKWLGERGIEENINLYLYSGEQNITWFLYAMNRCEYKYINMDYLNFITQALGGYMLSKSGTYYQTSDSNIADIFAYINTGRVDTVEQFLESVFSDKTN